MQEEKAIDRQSYFAWKKQMGIKIDHGNIEIESQKKNEQSIRFEDSEEPSSAQLKPSGARTLFDKNYSRNTGTNSFQSFGKTLKINRESFKERIEE